MEDAARLRELLDRQDIEDVVLGYCRGIDRMDRELVRACYHPDAVDDHGSFRGGVDEFLEWVFRLLGRYSQTMHFVGNLLVEVVGEKAAVESYGIAFHRSPEEKPHLNLMTGFRYLDRFAKRDGEWRIEERRAVTEWARVDDVAGRFETPADFLSGKRDRGDALYALLASVRAPQEKP
jgi:hypothetical protein